MAYNIVKYLRISLEDIELDGIKKYESDSIVNQRAFLNDFIVSSIEFQRCSTIEIVDDGHTGTNFNRPGVKELLRRAQRGDVDCIVVKDISRFGRNSIEVVDYLDQIFPALGVRFISVNDSYDSAALNGATAGIDIIFRSLIYELYSHDLSIKMRSSKDHLSRKGKIITTYPMYGYDKDSENRNKFITNTPESKIVKRIFNLAEQGVRVAEIVRILNADGTPTKQQSKHQKGFSTQWGQGDVWRSYSVNTILRDERYTGKWIYGKTRTPYVGCRKGKPVPRSEWIIVPGAIPAIISEEQFCCVQGILDKASRKRVNSGVTDKSIFKNKIRCGDCGRAMRYRPKKDGQSEFLCDMYLISDKYTCATGEIKESAIYDAVLSTLQVQAALTDEIKIHMRDNSSSMRKNSQAIGSKIHALCVSMEKAKSAKMSLWEQQHNGSITREAYQRESEKLALEISQNDAEIAELEKQSLELRMDSYDTNTFVDRFNTLTGIDTLTWEIVDEFIDSVNVYSPDRIEIALNYADDYAKTVSISV